MALAFSYRRFSSTRQEQGDSLRRQTEKAEAYARQHQLILDQRSFEDLGVSAFHGKNAAEGQLAAFLEAVESGLIPSDSHLLVESLDRLSRQNVDVALGLFTRIVNLGVTLVTIDDGQTYSRQTIRANWTTLVIALAVMARAFDESSTKSNRTTNAWKGKRERAKAEGTVMKAVYPAHLQPTADMSGWNVLWDKVAVIRRIFDLALSGLGGHKIAALLNAEGIPTITQRRPRSDVDKYGNPKTYKRDRYDNWTQIKVAGILKNTVYVGTYVPQKGGEPILDYYPCVVDKQTFYSVQEAVSDRRWQATHDRVINLFAGLARCAECGARMKSWDKYTRCLGAVDGSGCTAGRIPYPAAEAGLLRILADDLSEQLVPRRDDGTDPLLALTEARDDLVKKRDNLIDLAAALPDPRSVASKIIELETQIAKCDADIASARPPEFDQAQRRQVAEWFETLKDGALTLEQRRRTQIEIRRLVKVTYWKPALDDELAAVAMQYVEQHGGHTHYLNIPRQKIGGDRRSAKARATVPTAAIAS